MPTTIATTGASIDGQPPVEAEITVEAEAIQISSLHDVQPDRTWTYVDPSGHFHAWSEDKDAELPTLTAKREHVDCGDRYCGCGGEGYDVTVYECSICRAPVDPATVDRGPTHRTIPGPKSWRVIVATHVPPGGEVSVRVSQGDHEFFGVAAPSGNATFTSGWVQTELIGIGPLGRRCP